MFVKQYRLGESDIHGIGIFADQDIHEGELIWIPTDAFTVRITEDDLRKMSGQDQETIRHYGYFHKERKVWCFSGDDSRFINHSVNPTVERLDPESDGVKAKRNIKRGEELTQDYRDFEELRNCLP